MKVVLSLLVFLLGANLIQAQCGSVTDCNPNTGIYSNDNAADIAYDNMGSAFHTTYIKEPSGGWKVWGEYVGNDGTTNVLSPIEFNVANYPALTGTIYKMAVGSSFGLNVEFIVLTSTGLFALGNQGTVISNGLTTSTTFQKVTVGGKADGLPVGVSPADVKMMFASTDMFMITTCSGAVYVLSQNVNARGDGGIGSHLLWSRVMQNATTPLTNVIASRGTAEVGFALKSDGTIWTWGRSTNLGNGTGSFDRPYATQMYLPDGIPGVKMIQCTIDTNAIGFNFVSYYILGTNKKVYSLGANNKGQLGDRTAVDRLVWVNAKNPDNTIITDAAWISSNEHDGNLSSLAVIKTNGVIYTGGNNSYYMVGRTNPGIALDGDINYLDLPTGIAATDFITFAEAGGHTCALVKRCTAKYGYVGHRVRGSIGDGSDVNETIATYDFVAPPAIAVCGAQYTQPTIVTSNNFICYNETAIFNINGAVGDVITYHINTGPVLTITLGASGTQQVTVPNSIVNQTIYLTQVFNSSVTCTYELSVSATVSITPQTPTFTQVATICEGQQLNPLPTTSTNGVVGVWSPAINNLLTTTYTFTPLSTCSNTVTMLITVIPKITPTFTQVAPICQGDPLSLPSISDNGYSGTWSPAINNNLTTTYTFTPTPIIGLCLGLATMTVVVTPKLTPTFTQVAAICEGAALADLPLISNNLIEGTWSPAMNNLQTTTYTFTPTPITGVCPNFEAHMTIVVNQKQTPTFPAFATLCYGDDVFSLPLVSNNGFSGTWLPTLNNLQTTNYTFTPNANQCALTATAQVPVYGDFDFNYEIVCDDNNIFIEINPIDGSIEFNWEIDNAVVYSGSAFNLSTYLATTPAEELFPIPITISATKDNCNKVKDIVVTGSPCEIPNVITPNNDTMNDSFNLAGYNVSKLEIYSRWGRKVYDKANYLNEWHGQNNHGSALPDGVYFYIVNITSGDAKTGWIYVRN